MSKKKPKDPFFDGFAAHDKGSKVSDNPYKEGTVRFSEWRKGFLFAGGGWVWDDSDG